MSYRIKLNSNSHMNLSNNLVITDRFQGYFSATTTPKLIGIYHVHIDNSAILNVAICTHNFLLILLIVINGFKQIDP